MIFNVLLCGATEILALQRFAITNSPSSHPGLLPIFSGVTEIRTRDTLLGYTRFPGVPLQPLEHRSMLFNVRGICIIPKCV